LAKPWDVLIKMVERRRREHHRNEANATSREGEKALTRDDKIVGLLMP
jgi:hypothetical protein